MSIQSALRTLKVSFDENSERQLIAAHLHKLGTKRLAWLDVGCGDGLSSIKILKQLDGAGIQCDFYGLDPDIEAARTALASYPRCSVICATLEAFNPEMLFDIINIRQSGYYIEGLETKIVDMKAWLRPGGRIITTMWTTKCLLFALHEYIANQLAWPTLARSSDSLATELVKNAVAVSRLGPSIGTIDLDRWRAEPAVRIAAFDVAARRIPLLTIADDLKDQYVLTFLATRPRAGTRANDVIVVTSS